MCGVPVVGARTGGITGLIRDDIRGRLYDAWSDGPLADIMTALVNDPSPLERWRASLPRVKSIEEDAAYCERIYRELLVRRSAASAP
jgi:glycosyltransferase involved in cell wall biosynthesis